MTQIEAEQVHDAVLMTMPLQSGHRIDHVIAEPSGNGWVVCVFFVNIDHPCVIGDGPDCAAWMHAHGFIADRPLTPGRPIPYGTRPHRN